MTPAPACQPHGITARTVGDRVRSRHRPPLTVKQILSWADAHRRRTGSWPNQASGPIFEARGLTWAALDAALRRGNRGFPGGSSLALLLRQRRGRKKVGRVG